MKKRIITLTAMATLIGGGLWVGARAIGTVVHADDEGDDDTIALLDNCDPTDPAWGTVGGCMRKKGDVTLAEFRAFLFTTLSPPGVLIGHPSWRIQPSYLSTGDDGIRVKNGGGRNHTFTEVAHYGGGFVPQLNGDLSPALECLASPPTLAPGASKQLNNLSPGLHRFQCCIHPWMRAAIRIHRD